jgi:hypothetical protein
MLVRIRHGLLAGTKPLFAGEEYREVIGTCALSRLTE